MIQHLKQPTADTCSSTCIAMITGLQVEKIISEFHADYCARPYEVNEYTYLRDLGLNVECCQAIDGLDSEYVYIVVVPSLNLKATLHTVVVYWNVDEHDDLLPVVHDPNRGKEGKMWYHINKDREEEYRSQGGELFGSFVPLVRIAWDDVLSFRTSRGIT